MCGLAIKVSAHNYTSIVDRRGKSADGAGKLNCLEVVSGLLKSNSVRLAYYVSAIIDANGNGAEESRDSKLCRLTVSIQREPKRASIGIEQCADRCSRIIDGPKRSLGSSGKIKELSCPVGPFESMAGEA